MWDKQRLGSDIAGIMASLDLQNGIVEMLKAWNGWVRYKGLGGKPLVSLYVDRIAGQRQPNMPRPIYELFRYATVLPRCSLSRTQTGIPNPKFRMYKSYRYISRAGRPRNKGIGKAKGNPSSHLTSNILWSYDKTHTSAPAMADTFEMTGNTAILLIDPYNDFLHPEGKS